MTLDAAHIHLMLNHVPVIGAPLLALLLTIGLVRGSRELVTVSLVLAAGLAVVTGFVYLTGEPAEKLVEHAPWFREAMVETHEEHATVSLVAILATGVVAAAAVVMRARPRVGSGLSRLTWAGLVLSSILLGWTAWSGGQIRHEEVRADVVGR
jgi:NADH:ubiquinone oxidoreductase subunit 4 (subunit M)